MERQGEGGEGRRVRMIRTGLIEQSYCDDEFLNWNVFTQPVPCPENRHVVSAPQHWPGCVVNKYDLSHLRRVILSRITRFRDEHDERDEPLIGYYALI